jgi:solute carrier family 50 protein (sugar transporter)
MLSAKVIILEYVFPGLGLLLSNWMFFTPYLDVKKAVQKGSLGNLNPTPWAFMLGNCLGWCTYAILTDNLWIFFGNVPGLVLSIWLNMGAAKLQYQNYRATEMRKSFVSYLEKDYVSSRQQFVLSKPNEDNDDDETTTRTDGPFSLQKALDFGKIVWDVTAQNIEAPAPHEQITLVIAVVWLAVISLVCWAHFDQSVNELIIGCVADLNTVFFYGAPLSTIFEVLKTRNTTSIHITTMSVNTLNAVFWGAYGIAVLDPFVYAPNGIGAAFGAIQMFLCLTFPRTPTTEIPSEESDAVTSSASSDVTIIMSPIVLEAGFGTDVTIIMSPIDLVEAGFGAASA